jgi:hypothetical protein
MSHHPPNIGHGQMRDTGLNAPLPT